MKQYLLLMLGVITGAMVGGFGWYDLLLFGIAASVAYLLWRFCK